VFPWVRAAIPPACAVLALPLAPHAATPAPCSPAGRAIVAEVFYDATGDDTGWEFVELYNPVGVPCPLEGLRLEAGDGAGPGRWTLRWTGSAGDTIPPRGRFVVGGARVDPPPGALATLDLQNGPDAVRLVWPDGAAEVVGYGPLALAEYACGDPAGDAPAGQSLARIPDDAQGGSNALDFRAASPSPGRANQPARDAGLIAGALALDPEQPGEAGDARLAGWIENRGGTGIAANAIGLSVATRGAFGTSDLLASPLGDSLAPGDTASFLLALGRLPAGKQSILVRVALAGDGAPGNDADSLLARVGAGPLEITEIQFHPAGGEGEWVEVRNRSGVPLDPARYTLADRGAARGVPAGGTGPLAAESLAVLAQDRAALLARFPALDPARIWQVSPWAALNNANDGSGLADAVVLRDDDGTRCGRVDYSAAGVPAGVPLELRDGEWLPARVAEGTPLMPPSALPALAGRFAIAPRRVRAGGAEARFSWSLPWPRGTIAIEIYDLAGRRVARPLPETTVSTRGERAWPTGDLGPGLYLAVLRARPEGGGDPLTETVALRIEGEAP
jgi:hypothetical protein